MKVYGELRTARAEYERQLVAELKATSTTIPQAPSGAQVLDLWAHLRTLRDDGTGAWVLVHKILDLGWRPMGSVPVDFPREVVTNPRDEETARPEDYDGDLLAVTP